MIIEVEVNFFNLPSQLPMGHNITGMSICHAVRYRKNSNDSLELEILDFAFMRSASGLLSLPNSFRK